jgi:hypothetical protein
MSATAAALSSQKPIRRMTWVGVAACLALFLLAVVYWWNQGGEYQVLLALQPDLRVSEIDVKAGTMTVGNANEAFVLRCAEVCQMFNIGGKYPMLYRGAVMEYRRSGRIFRFPILQQHVNFDVVGGRG